MTTRPTSFRLSQDTLAQLKALALPHESGAQVIVRALDALEARQRAQDAPAALAPGSDMAQRLAALEARLAALEASSTPALQGQADVSQDKATGRATGSPHSKPDYPPEVRVLAVQLADAGTPPVEICARIRDACGRAPHRNNIASLIRNWRGGARDSA